MMFFSAIASALLFSKLSNEDELASTFISYLSTASLIASILILINSALSGFLITISLSILLAVQSSNL
jgi:hypothetical protein